MRSFFLSAALLPLIVGSAGSASAQHHPVHQNPVYPIHPNPGIWNPPLQAPHHSGAGNSPANHAQPAGNQGFGGYASSGNNSGGYGGGYGYNNTYINVLSWGGPGFGYGYGYYPYPYYLNGTGPYVMPPLFVPANGLFGPQPLQQGGLGMGVGMQGPVGQGPIAGGQGFVAGGQGPAGGAMGPAGAAPAPAVGAQGVGPIKPAPAGAAAAAPRPLKVRVSNAEAKGRAGKFIDYGDALFGKQRFREALERYKLASQQAPDMAEIYLRQGFAQVAMSQYETAGRSFRRALKQQPDWSDSEVQLNRLYGADHAAKEAHFEALALALQTASHDANLLFLMGMELYFDGQPERAAAFFTRSAQLGGNEDHLLTGFLTPPAKVAAPQAKQPPADI